MDYEKRNKYNIYIYVPVPGPRTPPPPNGMVPPLPRIIPKMRMMRGNGATIPLGGGGVRGPGTGRIAKLSGNNVSFIYRIYRFGH